ncbi:secreted trypsin-like serine protease [Arthrobacter pigmenti]|uniref:Secreted trypsin-like serine protease n=1 Tax=Arthrobacter pigmenti TaxID=271432 RepID=A0A846RRW3_9MICC|nr:trypsin-like serine protease [Arthrobacter pigmenti]NJC24290.1 secreted trypsin-like serine protease [Arthrobacter pigmenti]
MKKLKLAAIAALAATALLGPTGVASAAPDGGADMQIVGGKDVSHSAAPYTAQVNINGSFACSASQISAQWILTAKHCLGSNMSVNLGSANLGGGTRVSVAQTYSYNGGDLALLRLSRSVSGSYASLEKDPLQYQTSGNIYGWGRETANGPASPVLKTASVYIESLEDDAYGGPAYRHVGVDGQAWKGDSGGPLVVSGKVIGVASTSASGGTNTRASSWYSSVPHGISWITSVSGVTGS